MLDSEACVTGQRDCRHFQQEMATLEEMLASNKQYARDYEKAKEVMKGATEAMKQGDDEDDGKRKGPLRSDDQVTDGAKVKVKHMSFVRDGVDAADAIAVERESEAAMRLDDWESEDLGGHKPKWTQHAHSHKHDHAHGDITGQAGMLAVDHFLAHLASVLTRAQRDVVVPAMADMKLNKGYHSRVIFSIHILKNHNAYDPLEDSFAARFQSTISQLRVEGQQFEYNVNVLSMADDPALAMAYASSMRAAVVPTMLYDGSFTPIKRLYLDSHVLEHELKSRLSTHQYPQQRGTREIPIFIFSLHSTLPLFIDKHLQARALSSMVVAVQSNYRLWESPLSCNGRPIYWNLRNPLKAVLSATVS